MKYSKIGLTYSLLFVVLAYIMVWSASQIGGWAILFPVFVGLPWGLIGGDELIPFASWVGPAIDAGILYVLIRFIEERVQNPRERMITLTVVISVMFGALILLGVLFLSKY